MAQVLPPTSYLGPSHDQRRLRAMSPKHSEPAPPLPLHTVEMLAKLMAEPGAGPFNPEEYAAKMAGYPDFTADEWEAYERAIAEGRR